MSNITSCLSVNKGPSGNTIPADVLGGTGEQKVEYVPVEIGKL